MAQQVKSVENPNYVVAPLTTTAGTIVSRRRVKVPVNFQGTYGHQRGSYNYIATFDIADNESFVDLTKMTVCMDITPTWVTSDLSGTLPQTQSGIHPPLFDQNSQALFWRLMIGTSQGLKIEEIMNYSTWANIVSMHNETALHKEMNLLDYSDYSKLWGKDKGHTPWLDSGLAFSSNGGIRSGETRRLEVRFHHSSLLKSIRFLPLFLFRNGLRFEFEFDDIHRTFCYQMGPNLQVMEKINMFEYYSPNGSTRGAPLWLMANGNLKFDATNSGVLQTSTVSTTLVNSNVYVPNLSFQSAPVAASPALTSGYIHTLCLSQLAAGIVFDWLPKYSPDSAVVTTGGTVQVSDQVLDFYCFPFYIVENGVIVYEAFFSFTYLDYAAISGATSAIPNVIQQLQLALDPGIALVQGSPYTISGGATKWNAGVAGQNTVELYAPCISAYNINLDQFWVNQPGTGAPLLDAEGSLWTPVMMFPVYQYQKRSAPYYYKDIWANGVKSTLNLLKSTSTNPTLFIDYKNMFISRGNPSTYLGQTDTPVAPLYNNKMVHPYIQEEVWPGIGGTNGNVIQWDYQIKNVEMLLDVVKPSSEDFLKFQQDYQSPAGIPYQFKRILYKNVISQFSPVGLFQIPLNISVRSLSGIVIAMQDQSMLNPGPPSGTDFTKYVCPNISSFMRRGLYRAEVVVGGQTYPVYQLLFQPPGATTPEWSMSHILESENFFGVGADSFNPSFHPQSLNPSRNYMLAGTFGNNNSQIYSAQANASVGTGTGFYSQAKTPSLIDASSFVLAFSLQKDDVVNFATGIDSSQSGSITINLYFNVAGAYGDPFAWMQRPLVFNIWSICDAVFTLQNDANLIRY